MTLEEIRVELRELRWELQQQRWQDSVTLARLWAGERCRLCHADDDWGGPKPDRIRLVRVEQAAQRTRGRRIEALKNTEQLLARLTQESRSDAHERAKHSWDNWDDGEIRREMRPWPPRETSPRPEWCVWFEEGPRNCSHFACCYGSIADTRHRKMAICNRCKWRAA